MRSLFAQHGVPRSLARATHRRSGALPMGMQPLPVPVSLRVPNGPEPLTDLLRRGGLMPVQAGARGGNAQDAPEKLVPGGPVAITFITGDMDIAGSGTVTWVNGKEILAFGHPMFGMGETRFPMATATPVTVVPSLYSSFRLTNTGQPVGAMTDDHSPAIRGMVGAEAPTFPMKVAVDGNLPGEYNYTVAGHWDWGPFLAALATSWTVGRWDGGQTPVNYRMETTIRVADREEPLKLANEYTGYSVMSPIFDQILMPASRLMANEFQEIELGGVDVKLSVEEGLDAARIESVKLLQPEARPGQEVQLDVRLQPWRGEEQTRRVSIRIPRTARPGTTVRLLVCDAATSRMIERSLDPGLHSPENLDQLIRSIRQQGENNRTLVVRANVLERGMRYDGHAMPALPPSVTGVIRQNRAGATAMPLATDVKEVEPTEWILSGSREVQVQIVAPKP
jgi:hypothetical protein